MTTRGTRGTERTRTFDWSRTKPSIAVVETLAEAQNVEPAALDVSMYDHFDAEALDTLVESGDEVTVTLHVDDYRVSILGETVKVSER